MIVQLWELIFEEFEDEFAEAFLRLVWELNSGAEIQNTLFNCIWLLNPPLFYIIITTIISQAQNYGKRLAKEQ